MRWSNPEEVAAIAASRRDVLALRGRAPALRGRSPSRWDRVRTACLWHSRGCGVSQFALGRMGRMRVDKCRDDLHVKWGMSFDRNNFNLPSTPNVQAPGCARYGMWSNDERASEVLSRGPKQ